MVFKILLGVSAFLVIFWSVLLILILYKMYQKKKQTFEMFKNQTGQGSDSE